MDIRLDGKTALVTGASRGIGLATAARFVEAGANVMLVSRRADGLEAAAAGLAGASGLAAAAPDGAAPGRGDIAWFAAHVGEPSQAESCVDATLERYGSIDVLVNNAGTNPYFGPLAEMDVQRAEKTVQVNQTAVLVWSQLCYSRAMKGRAGSVVNVASVGAFEVEPWIGWYNVTKAAVVHLTRQLAAELGPEVRVNALAPGLVKTHLARALWEKGEESISRRLPLRRLGEPDDIAKAALFLASDAASWITGHTLVVDGGAMVTPGGGVSA